MLSGMKTNLLPIMILCLGLLFCFKKGMAQFPSAIIEGDFTSVKSNQHFDYKNEKYKDAPQVYFDAERNIWHACWTQFDKYKSKFKSDISVIYYAQSREGKVWSSAKQLNYYKGDCLDSDSTVKGPMPCVGVNGEVYVTWAGPKGLMFQCSLDSGKTWLKEEKIINSISKGWATKVDGIATDGLPVIACDLSRGEHRGRIYISWSDEKNGENNKDVFLVYSDDNGEHWTEPILVSYHPNHKSQFKPTLKVNTSTGELYLLYFDKQNYLEGKNTDITLAISKNGGLKFDYYKINDASFPFNSNYREILIDSLVKVHWVQIDDKKHFGLHEAIVDETSIITYMVDNATKEMKIERSFIFQDRQTIDFEMPSNALLSVTITKPLEPGFEKVIVKNKPVFQGKNKLVVDFKAFHIKKDNYIITCYYRDRNTFFWITEE